MGDTFLLERELRGGMSRVFVARETRLGRTVVLKVLPPELAASLSTERFRREIQVAANLQHPHIVPLLSAGEAGDFLYYTMPYIEGESLRVRLERQGELPVPPALRIIEQVARALSYAHRHGVIHRDIKPDNILLSEGEAQVADFGIAKAISVSAGEGALTSVGVALGTPLYMAPEQAAADPAADTRADLYSLGVVAYEVFAGQPPFQGRTPQQLLSAHALEQPAPLRDRRPAVSPALSAALMRLLEKRPADRPQSADELLALLDAASTAPPSPPTIPVTAPRTSRREGSNPRRWLVAGGVAALGLIVVVAALANREPAVAVDRGVVAIAPFRVSGADSSLAYLREGMVDLLAAKLSGTTGLRAADPRSLLAAWRKTAEPDGDVSRRRAIELAERLGAGRLIQGDVVGTQRRITVNAAILDASSGQTGSRASVEGSPDSIPRLVDQLTGKLLALEAGEAEHRLANLTSTSLPALRAYLEGQSLIRRADFSHAVEKFNLALQHDSTFALAGLGLSRAGAWLGQPVDGPGSVLAWRHRDKLSPVDRALLDVYLGARYPAPRRVRDAIMAAEQFARMAPDNVEAWQELGDNLYHYGPLVDISDALPRSWRAFSRALALDSSFAPALEHRPSLALALGDTAGALEALDHMLKIDSTSGLTALKQWEVGLVVGDSAMRRKALQNDSLDGTFMLAIGLSRCYPLADAAEVLRRNRARAVTGFDQAWSYESSHNHAVSTGWPSRAVSLPASIPETERLEMLYQHARFVDGDSAAGARAGATLESRIGTRLTPEPYQVAARYTGGQSALDHGQFELAQRALSDLSRVVIPPDSQWQREVPQAYALLLETQLAARRNSPELPQLLVRLDSTLVNPSFVRFSIVGNLIASRLFEEQGNLPQALVAIRRQVFDLSPTPLWVSYHREEGRLAALNGDREGAIRAYRCYLALRSEAEPRLQPQVRQVRAELEALLSESSDR